MYQHYVEITAFIAQRLRVFIAIAEHQCRIDTHHRHPQTGDPVEEIRRFLRRFREAVEEAFNVLRLTVG